VADHLSLSSLPILFSFWRVVSDWVELGRARLGRVRSKWLWLVSSIMICSYNSGLFFRIYCTLALHTFSSFFLFVILLDQGEGGLHVQASVFPRHLFFPRSHRRLYSSGRRILMVECIPVPLGVNHIYSNIH